MHKRLSLVLLLFTFTFQSPAARAVEVNPIIDSVRLSLWFQGIGDHENSLAKPGDSKAIQPQLPMEMLPILKKFSIHKSN